MATLSVVIPAWSGTPALAAMALSLCSQVRPMCDEIVLSEDGQLDQGLKEFVDVYLQNARRLGHARNLWQGLLASSGEFIAVLDSDIVITKGSLRDLCIRGMAVGGAWKEFPEYEYLIGWCFVLDRVLLRDHQIGMPEWEGLGDWIKSLEPFSLWTDKFEYSHLQKRSYSEKDRLSL